MQDLTLEERRDVVHEIRHEVCGIIDKLLDVLKLARKIGTTELIIEEGSPDASGVSTHGTIKCTELIAVLSRLTWLLGLTCEERSFVYDAATCDIKGDYAGIYETFMVFADWLEDQNRQREGVRIRRLVPEDGDVLLVTQEGGDFSPNRMHRSLEFASDLREKLKSLGRDVLTICLPPDLTLDRLDAAQMRHFGWMRFAEQDQLYRILADELVGQPEGEEIGTLTSQQIPKMIRRLKEENAELRMHPQRFCVCEVGGVDSLKKECAFHQNVRLRAIREAVAADREQQSGRRSGNDDSLSSPG